MRNAGNPGCDATICREAAESATTIAFPVKTGRGLTPLQEPYTTKITDISPCPGDSRRNNERPPNAQTRVKETRQTASIAL